MNTLRSAFVVVILTAMLYGLFVFLHRPNRKWPDEVASRDPDPSILIDEGNSADDTSDVDEAIGTGSSFRSQRTSSSVSGGRFRAGKQRPRSSSEEPDSSPSSEATKYVPRFKPKASEAPSESNAGERATPSPFRPKSRFARRSLEAKEETTSESGESEGEELANGVIQQPKAEEDADSVTPATHMASEQAGPTEKDAPEETSSQEAAQSSSSESSDAKVAADSDRDSTTEGEPTPEMLAAKARVERYAFQQGWTAAREQIDEGKIIEAHTTLSALYHSSSLPSAERMALLDTLDQLAGRVIYSDENLLEPAYVVKRGEKLIDVAKMYHVPFVLLQKINGIRDPDVVLPGTKLKVIQGPFRAEVDLKTNEVTLFLRELYAGRFPFSLAGDSAKPGKYTVQEKQRSKSYHTEATTLGPRDPRNPYGGLWIDLGRGVCLHGSSEKSVEGGCVSLAPQDAEDLIAILSIGSEVLIME